MADLKIKDATRADIPTLAKLFALSLRERTFVGYLCSHAADPIATLDAYFRICYDTSHRCTMYGDGLGGALWEEPGAKESLFAKFRFFAIMARLGPRHIPLCLRAQKAKKKARPSEPHFYLNVLGVHPEHQGKGIGAKLIQHTLRECDERRVGAYLETGNPDNIPFYERFGFKVRETATVIGATMTFHTMWREPV